MLYFGVFLGNKKRLISEFGKLVCAPEEDIDDAKEGERQLQRHDQLIFYFIYFEYLQKNTSEMTVMRMSVEPKVSAANTPMVRNGTGKM